MHNAFSAGNMDTISQVANISAEEIRDAIIALGFGCRSLSSRETGSGDMSKDSSFRPMWSYGMSNELSDIKTQSSDSEASVLAEFEYSGGSYSMEMAKLSTESDSDMSINDHAKKKK